MKRIFIILGILLWILPVYSIDIEILKKTAEETIEPVKKAKLYKEIGDYYVTTDDLKKAAEAYIKAVSIKRDAFSMDERLQMAIRLSWARRLNESLKELESILSEDRDNLEARIHYARVLSWSGRLDEALKEIDTVLDKEPENRDALLVKANTLRWKGKHKEAIEIYNNLLKKGDDFDTRLGLAYSLIAIGEVSSAEENIKLLKPSYPYQKKELSELKAYLKSLKGPQIHTSYSYYSDSDDNIVSRYYAGINMSEGLWRFNLNYRLTTAKDKMYENRAHSLTGGVYRRFSSGGTGASIGITLLDNEDPSNIFTGNISTDLEISGTSLFINITRDVMTDTALLIEREIKYTEAGIRASRPISEKASLEGSYRFRDYSDSNHSHDIQGGLRYNLIVGNPSISTGYRIRYLDFKRQTGNGYFDPDNFLSHQVFVSLYFEKERLYLFIEPYGGYQLFRRYNEKTEDFFTGGSMTLGCRIKDNLSIELNAEGGDYAAGAATGFKYWMAGVAIKGVF